MSPYNHYLIMRTYRWPYGPCFTLLSPRCSFLLVHLFSSSLLLLLIFFVVYIFYMQGYYIPLWLTDAKSGKNLPRHKLNGLLSYLRETWTIWKGLGAIGRPSKSGHCPHQPRARAFRAHFVVQFISVVHLDRKRW